MAETFATNLPLGQDGNTSAAVVDPFRTMLFDISGGAVDVSALSFSSTAIADVKSGAINLALISPTAIGFNGDDLLYFGAGGVFAMEPVEFLSWFYSYGGEALTQSVIDGNAIDLVYFPLVLRGPESGGWFKEPLSLKKMVEGKYADGSQMSFRFFGDAQATLNDAFPLINTPAPTTGVSEISEIFGGKYNGGEFNEPVGDASLINGMFPSYPAVDGSVIAAGLKHYYIGSWHTPMRCRSLVVNKTWFNTTLTATQRQQMRAAIAFCTQFNLADGYNGADTIIKQWQSLGAIIHRQLPHNVNLRLRESADKVFAAKAAASADYNTLLTSQINFLKENAVRFGAQTDRNFRIQRGYFSTDLLVDSAA